MISKASNYINLRAIKAIILKDIDKNLPNLQTLCLHCYVINGSEYTVDILSRLLDLKTIKLFLTKDSVKHEFETKLKEKCKRIQNIYIRNMGANERRSRLLTPSPGSRRAMCPTRSSSVHERTSMNRS